jgi:ligand-binding sensor domain-containing protein/AraC-like DNA-binding protein
MYKVITIAFLFFVSLKVSSKELDYSIQKYTVSNGLPSGKIDNIIEDHEGFMWFGTSNGLVKYDGYTFTNYKTIQGNKQSLASNIITCVYESPDSILFIGTRGGLHIYNRNTNNFERIIDLKNGIDSNFTVTTISADKEGNQYFIAADKSMVFKCSTNKITKQKTFFPFSPKRENNSKFSFSIFDHNNRLWLCSSNEIYRFENGTFSKMMITGKTTNFNRIIVSHKNIIYVVTATTIYQYNEKSRVFDKTPVLSKIKNIDITHICIDSHDNFYIASENNGLFIVSELGEIIKHFDKDNSLKDGIGNNTILKVYVDKANNIWLGLLANEIDVLFYKPKYYDNYFYITNNKHEGLQSNIVTSCFDENASRLWIGTDGGGLHICDVAKNKIKPVGTAIVKSNKIIKLVPDELKNLWICTYGGGLSVYHFKTSSFENIALQAKGIPIKNVYDVTLYKSDTLVVASMGQGLLKYNIKTKKSISIDSVKWHNSYLKINAYLHSIIVDRQKNIWISSLGDGLYEFDQNFTLIDHYNLWLPDRPLSNNIANSMSIDKNGLLWIGSFDGLTIINTKTKKVRFLSVNNGLPSSNIQSVSCIDTIAWVCTLDGISKINIKTLSIENIEKSDGIWVSNAVYNFVNRLKNGKYIVAGDNGFMIIRGDSIKNRHLDLNFKITNLNVNGKSIKYNRSSKIVLDYSQNNIAIEFAALALHYSSQIAYEYSIDGKSWIYLGNKHELLFPNMNNSEYTIKLKAYINGKKNQASYINLNLTIQPPFWKTWWFLFVVIICIIVITLITINVRLQSIKKQAFLLEQRVFERTQKILLQRDELLAQGEKLKKINDELVRTNSEQTKLFEIVSQKSKLTTNDSELPKSHDEELLEKTISFIHKHIDDVQLNVEMLSENANYSKIQFYRKIKALTELTPIDVIKTIRLQKAEEMLKTNKYTIAEVCYKVGFSDPKYFSKCFKEYYKQSPSDFCK